MTTRAFPFSLAHLGAGIAPTVRSIFRGYWHLIVTMTRKAPAFWAGCFFGALIAQFPNIALALIHLALARL